MKLLRGGIWLLFLLNLTIGCKPNTTEKKDNGLQEVRLDEKASNADIVRLPISADQNMDTTQMAKIAFEQTSYDFGEITEGGVVKHTFSFKNVGKVPLVITDMQTTCGCTVPDWNRNPIQPNATSEVSVQFNSAGKVGVQDKPIRVIANTFPSETVIKLTGTVKAK
jgi:hypothetical protein